MQKIGLTFSLFNFSQLVPAQMEYAVKPAETVMNTIKDPKLVKKFASHLEQDNQIPEKTLKINT